MSVNYRTLVLARQYSDKTVSGGSNTNNYNLAVNELRNYIDSTIDYLAVPTPLTDSAIDEAFAAVDHKN